MYLKVLKLDFTLVHAVAMGAPAKQPTATNKVSEDGERQRRADVATAACGGTAPKTENAAPFTGNGTFHHAEAKPRDDYIYQASSSGLAFFYT